MTINPHRMVIRNDWWDVIDELAAEFGVTRQKVLLDLLQYASIVALREQYEEEGA